MSKPAPHTPLAQHRDRLKSVGDRLRARRQALGYTQSEVAERAGLSGGKNAVSAIERGNPNTKAAVLAALIDALGMRQESVWAGTGADQETDPVEALKRRLEEHERRLQALETNQGRP